MKMLMKMLETIIVYLIAVGLTVFIAASVLYTVGVLSKEEAIYASLLASLLYIALSAASLIAKSIAKFIGKYKIMINDMLNEEQHEDKLDEALCSRIFLDTGANTLYLYWDEEIMNDDMISKIQDGLASSGNPEYSRLKIKIVYNSIINEINKKRNKIR